MASDGKESAGDKQETKEEGVPKCDEETQQCDEETMEDEYLRDAGEQIAAMMDPLGEMNIFKSISKKKNPCLGKFVRGLSLLKHCEHISNFPLMKIVSSTSCIERNG